MSIKASQLQALFAKRRDAEHTRVKRSEAVNKYFDHWGRVTARFENWTTPDYYKQADQQLENSKQEKEKQKELGERREKLAQLLEFERKKYEQEIQEKRSCKLSRRHLDVKTLEKIEENLKQQQQLKRKLELEAKLYGKWRHGVEDENLVFESKRDNEVLAKLNWLEKQMDQQLQREKEEEASKERQLKLQLEFNKSEELKKESLQIRENQIREIRCMQEHHLEELKERQKETEEIKEKEKQLTENINSLKAELQLLEENYAAVSRNANLADAYKFNKIKTFIRKRSEVFRNQIKLCLSIVKRTICFSEKPQLLSNFQQRLEHDLEREISKMAQIEGMYESEAKYSLKRSEELWQQEHTERYTELKQLLMEEYHLINTSLKEAMKKHDELLEIRTTHLSVIDNCSEKLKLLIQEEHQEEEEKSPRCHATQCTDEAKHVQFSQLQESDDTPLCVPHSCASANINTSRTNNNMHRISNSFNNLNLDVWGSLPDDETHGTNSQRPLEVVTPETEAERPRFGRRRVAWD